MGADLFGSLAEATCAALVVSGTSKELIGTSGSVLFPLMITAVGIIMCFITSFFATSFTTVTMESVESTIKWQLIISTVLMTGMMIPVCLGMLPPTFSFYSWSETLGVYVQTGTTVTQWQAFFCVASGLWSGLIIGYVTEIYTSN